MSMNEKKLRGEDVLQRTPNSIDVPVTDLIVTKNEPESTKNAKRLMLEAAAGLLSKRKPISVRGIDNKFEVLDGNATTNAAIELGIESLPATIENDK